MTFSQPADSRFDPGGPVDPRLEPQPVDEVDRPAAFTLMAPGWLPPPERITQAYGFCFTTDGRVVLVETAEGFWNLPGGQVEPGETARQALVREVGEEACARVLRSRYLACQHVSDRHAPSGPTSHYQTRWWARVELDPWQAAHETTSRRLVVPKDAVTALSWRRKTIARLLFDQALTVERTSDRQVSW
jgi:ADP-ribose pyrophosphatase YjhB (NUDIX family)